MVLVVVVKRYQEQHFFIEIATVYIANVLLPTAIQAARYISVALVPTDISWRRAHTQTIMKR